MTSLLRAVRALAGLDNAALDAVTPNAMRAVMEARGWRSLGGGTWHWYAPPTGVNARHPEHAATVRVGDWPAIVRTWAAAVATRHGDVAPAEVLAEALEEAKRPHRADLPDAVHVCPQCSAVAGVGIDVVLYLRGDADARRAQIEDHESSAAHVEAARKTVETMEVSE